MLAAPSVWAASNDAEAVEVVIAARDLAFDPDVIRAPAGAELTVRLTNAGLVPHNIAFTLDSGEILSPEAVSDIIGPGDTVSVTFTTPGPGRYAFLCQIHPLEMTGRLRVGGTTTDAEPVVAPGPLPLADHPMVDPARFRVTTFAWGLPYTTAMLAQADGSLLVAVNDADDAGLIGSTGKLLRMVDENGDGVADSTSPVGIVSPAGGRGPLVLRELPGAVIQMRTIGDLVLMTTRQRTRSHIVVLRAGAPGEHLRHLGTMTFAYPTEHVHKTYGIAVREGAATGTVEVYFNVGSRVNDASDPAPVAVSGLLDATVQPETIYRVTLSDDGESVRASDPTLIASGVRNGAGMAFHPRTGDLWFQDNGINLDDGSEDQLSADELNVIPAERLGQVVLDFGFPDDYVAVETGVRVGSGGEPPVVAFTPIDGSQSEGPAEIDLRPAWLPRRAGHRRVRRFPWPLRSGRSGQRGEPAAVRRSR